MLEQLIQVLRSQFNISSEAISLAQKTQNLEPNHLPIVLWQYGLLDSQELDLVLDWLEI